MTDQAAQDSALEGFENFAIEQQRNNCLTRIVVASKALDDAYARISEVMKLADESGLTDQEISDKCGITLGTVSEWRTRG